MQVVKIAEVGYPMKPVHGLLVRDWKEGVVNLVQFPRCHTIVSPSPFAVKLETWLRMNNIKYHNVSNEFNKASSKGQIPFIELGGRQFADSNFIIEQLRTQFKTEIDASLSPQEVAQARAFTALVEESLFRVLQCDRSKNFGWLATDNGYMPLLPSLKKFIFKNLVLKQMQSQLKKVTHAQGYGRHSQEEIEEIAKKDLSALSTQLGSKSFMFGEQPSTVDATMFGLLVQFTDTPLNLDKIKPYMEDSTPNLVEFVKRMKERYWPDWAECCENLWLNPEEEKKKAAEEAAKKAEQEAAAAAAAAATAADAAAQPAANEQTQNAEVAAATTEPAAGVVTTVTTIETTKVVQEG